MVYASNKQGNRMGYRAGIPGVAGRLGVSAKRINFGKRVFFPRVSAIFLGVFFSPFGGVFVLFGGVFVLLGCVFFCFFRSAAFSGEFIFKDTPHKNGGIPAFVG